MHQYRLRPTSWKTALCKRTRSSGRQQFEHEPELYHCGGQQPWKILIKTASMSKQMIFPLCSTLMGPICRVVVQFWGSAGQERDGEIEIKGCKHG